MTVTADIANSVNQILRTPWDQRQGQVVPEAESIALLGGAVNLDAVYLYCDMANSSAFAKYWSKEATAKVIRCFLDAACRVIRSEGGEIRSFDGDRVMAIFIGRGKCDVAARCALKINHAVQITVHEALKNYYTDYPHPYNKALTLGHCSGVASGEAMLVRGGVRGSNDLVSIGRAPNLAAKLSDVRDYFHTYITADVFSELSESVRFGGPARESMWAPGRVRITDEDVQVYRSTWWWRP